AIEKGSSGERAFEEAFEAWDQPLAAAPFQDRVNDTSSGRVTNPEEQPISLPHPAEGLPQTAFAPSPAATSPTPLVAPPTAVNPLTNEPKRVKTSTIPANNVSASDPTRSPAAEASGGPYVVQVSTKKTEDEARASYQALQQKFPAVLGGREAIIRRADLGQGQ